MASGRLLFLAGIFHLLLLFVLVWAGLGWPGLPLDLVRSNHLLLSLPAPLAIVSALLFLWLLQRWRCSCSDRIAGMESALRKFADGEPGLQIGVRHDDFLVPLETAFNRLSREVRATIQKLEVQKQALDQHAIVSITDANGVILMVNDNFCRISGYSPRELIGQTHRLLKSGEHSEAFYRELWQTIRRGEVWRGEIRNRAKDGECIWVSSTIVPLLDDHGEPFQYIAVSTDITEQKNALLRMRQLSRAVRYSPGSVLITDRNGVIEYVNQGFTRMSGWSAEEAIGRKPSILKSGKMDPAIYEEMWQMLLAGEVWSGRLLNRRRKPDFLPVLGGEEPEDLYYWVAAHIAPIMDENGKLAGFVGVEEDVTRDVEREERERHAREGAEARAEIAQILQLRVSLQVRMQRVLEVLTRMSGIELESKAVVFFRPPGEDRLVRYLTYGDFSQEFLDMDRVVDAGECLCGRALERGEMVISDHCLHDPAHERAYLGMQPHGHYIVPLMHGGKVLGVMALYTEPWPSRDPIRLDTLRTIGDMVGLAIANEQVRERSERARRQAEEASRTKSEFLANISHEIRTPMNGIMGMLELLRDSDLDDRQRHYLSTAYTSARTLLQLLSDILDLSKIEAGKMELESTRFDLAVLVEEVIYLLERKASEKGLRLACLLEPGASGTVSGDPVRLRQVLVNLLDNAIKFTHEGSIFLRLAPSEEGGGVRFEVHDTGIGIDAEHQRRIFDSFSQADGRINRKYGGTGLGLSISRQLVRLMGGDLALESRPGEGSCFSFVLPLEVQKAEDAPPPLLEGHSVLVWSGNPCMRRLIEGFVTQCGGVLVAREHPEEASLVMVDRGVGREETAEVEAALAEELRPHVLIVLLQVGGEVPAVWENHAVAVVRYPIAPSRLMSAVCAGLSGDEEGETTVPAESPPALPRLGFPCRVLLVEDNLINRMVAEGYLERMGCEVVAAAGGEEALCILEEQTFDLVLMDCQMPGLDGLETTRRIRAREAQRGEGPLPVIAVTAYAQPADQSRCLSAGMDDVLTKPYTPATLLKKIRRWLGPGDEEEGKPEPGCRLATGGGSALLDETVLAEIASLSRERAVEIVQRFIEGVPHLLREIDRLVEEEAWEELGRLAHTLQGSAGSLGLSSLANACHAVVTQVRRGEAPAPEVVARWRESVDAASVALHGWLDGNRVS